MTTETRFEWVPKEQPPEGWTPRFNDWDDSDHTMWKLYTLDDPDGAVYKTQRRWIELESIAYERTCSDWEKKS